MEDATAQLLPFSGIPMLAPVREENGTETPARPGKCLSLNIESGAQEIMSL